jgi:hypothetical protein
MNPGNEYRVNAFGGRLRNCYVCKEEIDQRSGPKRAMCQKCEEESIAQRKKPKICVWCRENFVPGSVSQRFCTPECREQMRRITDTYRYRK